MIVFVTGMHRSGTSAVASVLQGLGVHMGAQLLPADEWNRWGYYEDVPGVQLSEAILRVAGGTWSDPPNAGAVRIAGAHLGSELQRYARMRGRNAPETGASSERVWGLKDPRLCLTLGSWLDVLPHPPSPSPIKGEGELSEVVVVWVWRRRQDVVASLMRRAKGAENWWLAMRPAVDWLRLLSVYAGRLQEALATSAGPRAPFGRVGRAWRFCSG
jgi:hypothetical protein